MKSIPFPGPQLVNLVAVLSCVSFLFVFSDLIRVFLYADSISKMATFELLKILYILHNFRKFFFPPISETFETSYTIFSR